MPREKNRSANVVRTFLISYLTRRKCEKDGREKGSVSITGPKSGMVDLI